MTIEPRRRRCFRCILPCILVVRLGVILLLESCAAAFHVDNSFRRRRSSNCHGGLDHDVALRRKQRQRPNPAGFYYKTEQAESHMEKNPRNGRRQQQQHKKNDPPAAAADTSRNGDNNTNEWDIPDSASLEPLGPISSQSQLPKQLPNGGRVTLVGAGPGDPNLLTVAAYRLLTESDRNTVVIADRLVSDEILSLIPAAADVKRARKLPGCAHLAQEEIYYWAWQALRAGKHVIRLKIGDPFVFGRGGEEVLTFRTFGIEATVIPGVSAAFSAPLLGSIPVTHRGAANQVVMCTGYGREGSSPDLIQYHREQTVVFLMAVGRLRELCRKLQDLAGYPADTPVAVVERAGCPAQRTVVGTIRTIADLADQYSVRPPSTIVVGDVVNVLLQKDDRTGQHVTGLIQNSTAAAAVPLSSALAC